MNRNSLYTTLILFLLIMLTITGCSKNENPWETFDDFRNYWEDKNYEKMYSLLSEDDKSTISKDDFIKTYKSFYESLGAAEISVKTQSSSQDFEDLENDAILPFTAAFTIPEGDVEFTSSFKAVKSDDTGEWSIDWDYDLIWPDFTPGDNLKRTYQKPVRGEIYDINGKALAQNGYVLQIGLVPGRLGDMRSQIISEISSAFGISEKYINDRLSLSWVGDETFVDLIKVSRDYLPVIKEINSKNNGATYREILDRVYPYKESAGHLTGYLAYPTSDEITTLSSVGFDENDKIGRTGLEKVLDEKLRGIPGFKLSLRDNSGNDKIVLIESPKVDGENFTLNIDAEIQKKLYSQFNEESGVASVMNYETGEIIALVSAPSYDPNKFILGMSSTEYSELEKDTDKPLVNRFTSTYSPGSIFKPITASIALNEEIVDSNYSIEIIGKQWQKDSSWGGYYVTRVNEINGEINLEKAMIYSDNIFFANLALEIGESTLLDKASDFGIGASLAVDMNFKDSQVANNDSISDELLLADSGYGQGEVMVNVLNMPKAYSAFVNNGKTVEPMIVHTEGSPTYHDAITSDTASTILDLLEKTVTLPYGTGHGAYLPNKKIAGKTGTAEITNSTNSSTKDELGWFVAIDQSSTTPYITTMMLENVQGRGGSSLTVTKVKAFISSY
ncbi:penicillin-binding transpeptidase domain-containing protein [Alkalibacter mobilis]|uniref:penicillin-binding transpeptidase domain-containing protein n=1 Tax=Alkalibacter mobilis TaxID=2787712 RepID=UPI0018A09C4C|nr:penicillin-binding transpeptidase domain-containing protein [Alkalibacter mobilis]MBF7097701.1 hypothetical protein [Alkalibacter mobilis]